ncbi:UNKNOWN [Stylonychia lemnae]|uniref:Uncharacterized protein n=1 Tax=Stylonychia lemnae TaxID=5949 RepID=A0A078AI41_STYLE|nr:UNKNOWN [Stylonychia lemnae]|eukprot:CDW81606.1 UNKNOWN [Stylonychia lemnae]
MDDEKVEFLRTCEVHPNFRKIYVCLRNCEPKQLTYCLACSQQKNENKKLVHDHKEIYVHVMGSKIVKSVLKLKRKYDDLYSIFYESEEKAGIFIKYKNLIDYLQLKNSQLQNLDPQSQRGAIKLLQFLLSHKIYLELDLKEELFKSFLDVFTEGDLSDMPEFAFENYRLFTQMKEKAQKILSDQMIAKQQAKISSLEDQVNQLKLDIEQIKIDLGLS